MPLKVSDGIGAWIKDFKKSDAPQFKGKSDKERRDQAIAAYLSAKRDDKNENVRSADKKPQVYTKPDGKRGIRMVATDRSVIKTESSVRIIKPKDPKKFNQDKKYPPHLRGDSIGKARKAFAKTRNESVNEETNFAVNIEGLPMMFMSADSPGMLKQTLRKIVKQPSMIQSVKRVTDATVRKTFRLKAQGRDEEQMDEAKLHEGTWAIPETPKQKAELKKLMSKPIKLGKDGEDASGKIYALIGDDELFDDLYVAGKKNSNGDARPIIKKHMKRLRIK